MNDSPDHRAPTPTIKKYDARVATNGFTWFLFQPLWFFGNFEGLFYRRLRVNRTERYFFFGRHRLAFDDIHSVVESASDARIVRNDGKVYRVKFYVPVDDFLVQVKAWGVNVVDVPD